VAAGHEEERGGEGGPFAVFVVGEDVPPKKGKEVGVQAIKEGVVGFRVQKRRRVK
jgi:hypothetical protein